MVLLIYLFPTWSLIFETVLRQISSWSWRYLTRNFITTLPFFEICEQESNYPISYLVLKGVRRGWLVVHDRWRIKRQNMSRSTELCDLQGAFTVSERENESDFTWEIVLFILNKIFMYFRSAIAFSFTFTWCEC